MREIKSITGLRVLSVDEGANVGTVSQVVVDLAQGRVLGLILGDGPGERGVPAEAIQTIGTDVIMVSSREVAKYLSELPELDKRRQPATLPVFTSSGRRLGVISSIFIDPYEKVITRYEVSSGPLKDLADGVLILPIVPGTVHGQDAVILPDEAVANLGREAGGWLARFNQWGDSARKQVQHATEEATKLYETSSVELKKDAEIVRQRAEELAARAREAVSKLGEKEEAAPSTVSDEAAPEVAADVAPAAPAAEEFSEAEAGAPLDETPATDDAPAPAPKSSRSKSSAKKSES